MSPTDTDAPPRLEDSTVSAAEQQALQQLRQHRKLHRKRHPVAGLEGAGAGLEGAGSGTSALPVATLTRGQRLADRVAATIGSWRFILIQSSAITVWIIGNQLAGRTAWDPYPFILLNLLLSFQAAYTAPAIMMSQNRQSELDRHHALNDYEVNVKAELEIELLHEKIDLMKERELLLLSQAVKDLSAQMEVLTRHLTK
jgi:uncharacterized membrane protein